MMDNTIATVCRSLLLVLSVATGVVRADVHVSMEIDTPLATPGDHVALVCRVTGAKLGDIAYLLKQVLTENGTNPTDAIATNTILTPLFESLGRFEVDVVDAGDAHLFLLNINGVTYEDSGLYGCKIAGHAATDSARLEVYKQSSDVYFVGHGFNDPYVFYEGVPQEVQCYVNDVIPAPNIRLFTEDTDYTDSFIREQRTDVHCDTAQGSKTCPIHFTYDVILKHVAFLPDYHMHGKFLFCESVMQVPFTGMEPITAKAPIVFHYSPKFLCDTEYDVPLYEALNLTCHITSFPAPSSVTWHFTIGSQHIELETGDSIQGFQALQDVHSGTVRSYTLAINQVQPEHITMYSLNVQQEIGNETLNFTVSQYKVTTEPIDAAPSLSSIVTLYISLVFVSSTFLFS